MAKFLIVDKAASTVSALRSLLEDDGHEVRGFTNCEDALHALGRGVFEVVIAELDALHAASATVISTARRLHPRACVLCTRTRPMLAVPNEACFVFEKPLNYQQLNCKVAECRARGGPNRKGLCHLKAS